MTGARRNPGPDDRDAPGVPGVQGISPACRPADPVSTARAWGEPWTPVRLNAADFCAGGVSRRMAVNHPSGDDPRMEQAQKMRLNEVYGQAIAGRCA
ncbi:MAG: hypothetical protein A2340_11580 [Lentisphaerae bacterium RIFOXYB12_FULL_60_10]|nr:MAG: hypothetical protein A2340_11580 [Lentisphaerae bacterium RIFOXYB12_FULL_60_10]